MPLIPLQIPAGVYRNGTEFQGSNRWRDANLVRWVEGTMRPVRGWEERVQFEFSPPRAALAWQDNSTDRYFCAASYNALEIGLASNITHDITPHDLVEGLIDAAVNTGAGGGFYGLGFFGTPRAGTGNYSEATTWSLDNWGEYLAACSTKDGRLLEWDLDLTKGPELVATPDFATDTNWTKNNGGAGNSTSNWSITGGVAAYAQLIKLFDADDDTIVDPTTDAITIPAHGFGDGDEVTYTVPAAPASAIGGLVGGTNYFVVGSTTNTIQLAATSGGAAINLTPNNSVTFDGDDSAVVDTAADKIVEANTFTSGDYITYDNGGGTDIGGLTNGANYYIVNATASEFQLALTSGGTPIDLTPDYNITFDGDDAAIVDVANDKIIAANTFTDGDEVTYTNGGGANIGGLTDSTNYFIINASATEFQLSATSGGAAITLTANNAITFDGDDATVVDVATDTIIEANTFSDGDLITYSAGGGVAIGGLADGANYFIINSSATDFQLSLTSGGAAVTLTANNSVTVDATDPAVVDVATDVITIANTFADGDLVTYNNGGGTDIAGLVNGTDYYIISASATDFQVSLTSGGAAVDLTALGTGTAHVFRQDIGSSHEVRQDIGSSHNLEEDIGSAHEVRVDIGTDHEFARVNFGNLEQTVSGLNDTGTPISVGGKDVPSHDIIITLIDPDDDSDATTVPDVNIKITGTTTATVMVDEKLSVGLNRFRFDPDDSAVNIEIIPNAYNTPNFDIDDVSLRNVTTAMPIANAPTDNLGLLVTEERFLMALGSGGNPRRLQWCDRENNQLWTPAATNEAGDIELQTTGQIMQGIRTRGQSLIITDTDAHSVTYIGGQFVYGFQRVGSSCGAISRKSAAAVDEGVFWMGQRGFFGYAGGAVQDIACEVGDYVFNDINTAQASKVWSVTNQQYNEIWWFYCSGGSNEIDRYVSYNYKEGHWSIGQLSRTAGLDRGVFRRPMWFTTGGKAYNHDTGLNYEGADVFAESGPISLGSGDNVMAATMLIPDELTQGDVSATFKTRFHPNDVERSYGPYALANPTSVRFTGRQVRMRVEGERLADWRVGVMRLDAVAGSKR